MGATKNEKATAFVGDDATFIMNAVATITQP
jgi:hypothetical protein